jgi:hypothetical protein
MKSFISEDKTVLKAIEKAMLLAGNPTIFTIKILESGIQSIFWWQNKAAVILFSYQVRPEQQGYEIHKAEKRSLTSSQSKTTKNVKNHSEVRDRREDHFLENRYIQQSISTEATGKKSKVERQIKEQHRSSNPFQENNLRPVSNEYKKNSADSFDGKKNIPDDAVTNKKEKYSIKPIVMPELIDKQDGDHKEIDEKRSKRDRSRHKKKIEKTTTSNAVESLSSSVVILEEKSNEIAIENRSHQALRHVDVKKEKEIEFLVWTDEQVAFVSDFIVFLNKDNLFSDLPIRISLEDGLLVIAIENLRMVPGIEKKHLFSSLVVIIYEQLKARFSGFESKQYRLIIR